MINKTHQKKDNPVSRVHTPDTESESIQSFSPEATQQKQVEVIENSNLQATQQKRIDAIFGNAVQREANPEEEELAQTKAIQKQAPEEEELPTQGKFEHHQPVQAALDDDEELPAQGKFIQRAPQEEEELPAQGKFTATTSQMAPPVEEELPAQGKMETLQKKDNNTGMPDEVKQKMEASFNTDFSDVKVHANSSKAPEVGALAYTQGSDVHFAPGQFQPDSGSGQQLLGHELAHVVQQREGRVQPTTEVAGMPVNDDASLENEADALGAKASG
ncbi:MAG: DUF4157 domain-containing protein [Bacteroidales bacterium]|nr:DUF4157 domain-containing protein [Bacteroidales bacterium]